MASVLVGLALVFSAIVQATFIPESTVLPISPDLTLVILLIWSAVRGVEEGLVWAFATGMLLDALSLDPLGGNALALLPVVIIGGIAGKRFFHSGLIVPLIAAFVATFLHAIVLLLVRSASGDTLALAEIARVVGIQSILNVILVPPIYLMVSLLNRSPAVRHA